MPKYDKNGKKPQGKKVVPMSSDDRCNGKCQYNVSEEVVENKKVKEKDVFDKKTVAARQSKTKAPVKKKKGKM